MSLNNGKIRAKRIPPQPVHTLKIIKHIAWQTQIVYI